MVSVHEKKKPFQCDICGTKFSQKSRLDSHLKIIHEGKKTFKCDICDANFAWDTQLSRHISKIHANQTKKNE